MRVTIKKGVAKGSIFAPSSKSMAHRMLICAGLSRQKSVIDGVSSCEDVSATLDCLKALGVEFTQEGDRITVFGKDPFTLFPKENTLKCRESGSTLRFLIPIAMLNDKVVMLKGAEKLLSRPMTVYENLAKEKGLTFINDGQTVVVKGPLKSGEYVVNGNISSQFISGLLFALPLLDGDSVIKILPPVESRSYINMTVYALALFGVSVVFKDENTLYIKGNQSYKGINATVEGDYSNTAFYEAFNYLGNGSNVKVLGLNENSTQGDKVYQKYFKTFNSGIPSIHLGDCPDLAPILFSLSAVKNGGIFSGTHRLKIKESDRGQAMAEELEKFGVIVKIHEDSITVYPINFHAPTKILKGHNDHRIVMALSVLLTLTGGTIDGAEAINKSNPDFFNGLTGLGIEVKYDDK